MRILDLVLSGFGSYAGEIHFPMEELGHDGLFLVTGDTGSGKTTLFDGICYGLYGAASGSSRDSGDFVCRYRASGQKSFVKLRFILGNLEFSLHRMVVSKGEKFSKEETASLVCKDDSMAAVAGAKEVTAKIEELLRLKVGQFRQIAMIAQGEYREILLTSSKDRTEIFRKLFLTEKYEALTQRLDEDRKEIEGKIGEKQAYFKQKQEEIAWGKYEKRESVSVTETLQNIEDLLDCMAEDEGALVKELAEVNGEIGEYQVYFSQVETLEAHFKKKKQAEADFLKAEEVLAERTLAVEKIADYPAQLETRKEQATKWALLAEDFALLGEKREELLDSQGKVAENQEKLGETQGELAKNREEIKKSQEFVHANEGAPLLLEQGKQKVKEWEDRENQVADLEKICKNEEKTRKDWEKAQKKYLEVWGAYQEISQRYQEKMGEHLEFQAGFLAKTLKTGEPCPVCGSVTHIKKAVAPEDAMSWEELEELKGEVEVALTNSNEASEGAGALSERAKLLEKQVVEGAKTVFDCDVLEKLGALIQESKGNQAGKEAVSAVLALEKTVADLELMREQMLTFQKREEVLVAEEKSFAVALASEKSREEQLGKTVAELEKRGDFTDLAEKMAENTARITSLQEEWEKKQENLRESQDEIQKIQGQRLELAENPVAVDLNLRQEKAEGQARAKGKLAEIQEGSKVLHHEIQQNEKILADLRVNQEEMAEDLAKAQCILPLAQVAKGSYEKALHISLETFVQQGYFDRALGEANEILRKICPNTYELSRNLEKNRRSLVGLDINILDLQSRTLRRASTLSGGESFQAALALALGFSQVVQQESAALPLASLFVDEGFGSLDDRSLAQAVDMLVSLGQTGRVVGVISHVSGLKEKIERKIQVEKSVFGSEIRFEL